MRRPVSLPRSQQSSTIFRKLQTPRRCYADDTLFRYATYVREREDEFDVLRDPSLADEARRRGVELVNFTVI